MHFTKLVSALTLTLAAVTSESVAQTVTYRGYSSTVQCSGANFFCSDGGAVCCGPMPAGFGFSAQFENLPLGSQGQGYTDACRNFLFAVFGSGTKCWNGGGARANFLNWFHSASRRAVSDGTGADCATPTGFNYKDGAGVEHTIKVPSGEANATEVIAEHFKNQNWKALAAYESA
ncbi:hypothetical protein FA13DRAFT_1671843 [Coprinellus micaceus]|uniref:Uncharacterized protein n=1 Tax=Coprinellus micaceus TaxID=71717 RepID=A0A4Y7SHS0_COPMI|nr:hypothetical protein FA13DRAFT_1671843 [Coprinellus micaceus]